MSTGVVVRQGNVYLVNYHCQTSDIGHTKYQNLNGYHLVLQLSLSNLLKPGVKSERKVQLEQRRQVTLQLYLSDQQSYDLLCCDLYEKLDVTSYLLYWYWLVVLLNLSLNYVLKCIFHIFSMEISILDINIWGYKK